MGRHRRGNGNRDARTSSSSDNDDYYHRHKKGTGMVGRKELIIDHDIGPLQVVLIEIISENNVSTLEKENIHPIPIITKVGQYQLAIDAVHIPGQVPQRENGNNLHTTIYMSGIHVLCLLIDATEMVLTVHLLKDGIVNYHQEGHICILQIHIIIELTLVILVDKSCLLMRHVQKCRFRTIQIMLVSLTCPGVNHVLYHILGL